MRNEILPLELEALATLRADLNFVQPTSQRLHSYAFDPPDGGPRSNASYAPQPVTIRDARPLADSFDLDTEGFAIVRQASAVRDFWDEEEIRRVYYAEAERLIAEVTGANRVLVFDHTLRRRAGRAAPAGDAGACRSDGEIRPAAGSRPVARRGRKAACRAGADHQPVAPNRRTAMGPPAGRGRCALRRSG